MISLKKLFTFPCHSGDMRGSIPFIVLMTLAFGAQPTVSETVAATDQAPATYDLDARLSEFSDLFETPTGLVWGDEDAAVRVIGFFDYTSILSKHAFRQMPAFVQQHPHIRVELRELPSGTPASERLARFALAVRMVHGEDGYRAMHLHLLRMQDIPPQHVLGLIAQEGRFDINQIEYLMDADHITRQLQDNLYLYQVLGAPDLPAFVTEKAVYPSVPTLFLLPNLLAAD